MFKALVVFFLLMLLIACESEDDYFYHYVDGEMRWLTVSGDPEILSHLKILLLFDKNEIIYSNNKLKLSKSDLKNYKNKQIIFNNGHYIDHDIIDNYVFQYYSAVISYKDQWYGLYDVGDFHFLMKYKFSHFKNMRYHPDNLSFFERDGMVYFQRTSRITGSLMQIREKSAPVAAPIKLYSINEINNASSNSYDIERLKQLIKNMDSIR